jgi:pimeloyl-ACP methyl ester carboxylesterase
MFAQRESMQDYRELDCPVLLLTAANGAPPAIAAAPLLEELLPRARRIEIADAAHMVIASHANEVAGYISAHASDCFTERS